MGPWLFARTGECYLAMDGRAEPHHGRILVAARKSCGKLHLMATVGHRPESRPVDGYA